MRGSLQQAGSIGLDCGRLKPAVGQLLRSPGVQEATLQSCCRSAAPGWASAPGDQCESCLPASWLLLGFCTHRFPSRANPRHWFHSRSAAKPVGSAPPRTPTQTGGYAPAWRERQARVEGQEGRVSSWLTLVITKVFGCLSSLLTLHVALDRGVWTRR